eukprot:9760468-Lingulodinium_polyedra.AAC.1
MRRQKLVCPRSARACDLGAVVAAKRWFDRVIVQLFANVPQLCARVDVSLSQPKTGLRVECASVLFVSRCASEASV